MLAVFVVTAQLAIAAHAPDTVFACDALDLTVAITAKGSSVPRLAAPLLQPFDVLRSGSPRIQYSSARSSMVVEHRFTLTTDRVGRFTIPAFEARVGPDRVSSRPLQVVVLPMRARGIPTVVARARIDTSPSLNLRATDAPDTVFVGQQATYEVAVFLNQTVRDRLRRNPTFYPPEMQAMLAYDLPSPGGGRRERVGSQCFDALVYRRALFPLVAGRLVIPPAQLVYSTGLSASSLFSREESHELQTDSVTIVAVEPPASGRPSEYLGTVGDVRLESRLDSLRSRVGDPMLFTVRVTGSGNVKLFSRPVVNVPWAGMVPADERVAIDSTNPRIGGSKEFDWVLTPRIAGEFDIPPVRYGYFDPAQRRYDVAVSEDMRVHIAPGALATADTGQAEPVLAIRTRYGGPAWPPLQSRPVFWLTMALIPIPAIVGRARRRSAATRPVRPHDPMRSLATAPARDAVALRRQFVRALAQRLGCNPEDFTHPGALERALRRSGVSSDTARRAELLLRQLDIAAYAGVPVPSDTAVREAAVLAHAVDAEALSRSELPFWVPALLLGLGMSVVVSVAIAADSAATHFARGVSSYVRQEYPSARESFAMAARTAPTSPDAWANYGTAAWSMSDTALAVLGWRQALALQPGASDVHQHLELPRSIGPSAPGWVPPLPRNASVWLFALLWGTAWIFAWVSTRQQAWSARNPHAWVGRLPLPLAACALLVGLGSIELETVTSGARLAVVRRATSLTSEPAIGMDRGPGLGTGEIVTISGRRGGWTRVEATEDRAGWIPSSQLLPIADRRPPRD